MKNFFVRLYDTILPPHPDVLTVREISASFVYTPHIEVINNLHVSILLSYRAPMVGACIRAVKYHHHKKAMQLLGDVLRNHLQSLPESTVVIPVPLSRKRIIERGHNQVASVLKAAGISYQAELLTRSERHTQTTLTRANRFTNVNGVMAVAPNKISYIAGKDVLIIDDVVTTGATLAEAGRAIATARPASMHYLALAH